MADTVCRVVAFAGTDPRRAPRRTFDGLPTDLCQAAVRPLDSFFQVQTQKPASMYRMVGSALVANTALNIALVPVWGARGAAVAASASGIVAVVVAYRAIAAESHARLADLWPRRADINAYVELASSLLGRGRDRT